MPVAGAALDAPGDLIAMIGARAAVAPDEWAVASRQGRLTWAELDDAVDRWAGALSALGLRRGDRVASLMPNRLELVVHYLGCIRGGFVSVPLNYRYVVPQMEHALEASGASVLLAHVERFDELGSRFDSLPLGTVWLGDDIPEGLISFGALLTADNRPPRPPADRSDPAFIFFTSGSTGPAKGVTHTLETMGWMAATAAAAFEMTDEDVFLPASSMSHLGAFLWTMSSLSIGARVVVPHTTDGDEVLSLIRAHRPTLLAMIPAALTALVREHGPTKEDFASLRLVRAGADHVPSELEHEFIDLTGFPIDEGYGMTEVGLATLNPPSGVIKEGSIGTTVPGVAISVRDEDGEEVGEDTVGRVWISTPSATVGYWENPTATSELFENGWLDSGDLARLDPEGYLWFFGRAKQIIVHDGSNVSPQEVEDSLSEHPAIAAAGVVGIHDALHGENVRAYVTLVDGASRPTCQELIEFSRRRVGYRAPEEIVVLDELPLNPTGKVDRLALKRMAQDHRNPERAG
jgi:long-chain acyl-CoA synthetase